MSSAFELFRRFIKFFNRRKCGAVQEQENAMSESSERSWRDEIIRKVQKVADTEKQKIDASIVSRVASLTIDETLSAIQGLLSKAARK